MKQKRRRLVSVKAEIARVTQPAPMFGVASIYEKPLPASTYEVVQHHPATCRTNLLAWGLVGPEASRILDELEAAQRARQGAVVVDGHLEQGWVYAARVAGRTA